MGRHPVFDQIQEEAIKSEMLKKAAAENSKDDFRYVFERAFEGLVIDLMEGNEEIFGKLMARWRIQETGRRAPAPQSLESFEED